MFSILQLGYNGHRRGQQGHRGSDIKIVLRHLPLEGGGFQLHAAIHKTIGLQTPAIMTYLARLYDHSYLRIIIYHGSH